MRLTRLHLLLLTVTLLSMPLTAQQLVQARVEVDASALGATGAKEVEGLRERIQKFADGFSPDVRLSMTPKEPMQVSLYIRLTSGAGQHFTGDLTLTTYRPIYGSKRQTTLCMVMEREVPIQNSEARSFFPLQGTIPESILGRRLYYYLSVAMLLYYDSFDTLGGQPFLDHLLQRSEELGDAWREGRPACCAPQPGATTARVARQRGDRGEGALLSLPSRGAGRACGVEGKREPDVLAEGDE